MADLALYLHWPFCESKCPYCDFNSHVAGAVDHAAWQEAFLRELSRTADETPERRITSVFFGGGTPSLMEPKVVGAILDAVAGHWTVADEVEISLEANPSSVEAERLAGFRSAGVGRVSLGVQALRDADLRRLGRRHDVAEALAAMRIARELFDRTSFDLIYARQDQGLADWRAELGGALSFAPDHLSLYQLTVEPGTPFAYRASRGGLRGLPDEDLGADLFAATQEMCEAAGLPAYEISNHARPGFECRHNLTYWTGGDWAGIGPGAHGRLTLKGQRFATVGHMRPATWLEAAAAGCGEASRELVPVADADEEAVIMGLRLRDGLALSRLSPKLRDQVTERSADLVEWGLAETIGDVLRLTPAGRPILDGAIRQLLA